MKKIRVRLKDKSYDIVIGRNLLEQTGKFLRNVNILGKVLIISDRNVARDTKLSNLVKASLKKAGFSTSQFNLPFGSEKKDKTSLVLIRIWDAMARARLDRSSTVIGVGGGVTGDVAGFAASTYMRGINLVHIPTTLLAQVDSSIGGKTAIDLPLGKNLAGTFYQPRLVISDLNVLEEIKDNGLFSFSEIVKYGVIRDPKLFSLLEENGKLFLLRAGRKKFRPQDFKFLENIIYRSAKIKAEVVARDEFETKGERMILNYGHTFAHALEGVSGYRLPHGEAVGLGMILAARLGVRLGITPPEFEIRQFRLIESLCPVSSLKPLVRKYHLTWERLKPYFFRDKKALQGVVRFIVPTKLGHVIRVEVKGNDWNLVRSAVESLT